MPRTTTALSALQKTFDDTYLVCSKAAFYEGQGNEVEAMRCWRSALDRIYEYKANRTLPSYTLRSDTERALTDSLGQLELQCKERIDLLEALRISRAQDPEQDPAVRLTSDAHTTGLGGNSATDVREQTGKGWIGEGTIPAITYKQLSRPESCRKLLSSNAPLEKTRTEDDLTEAQQPERPSSSKAFSLAPGMSSPDTHVSRTSSPERHTMRTTLRSAKKGKATSSHHLTVTGRPGANKAASMAWAASGPGQLPIQVKDTATTPSSSPRGSSEQLRKSQWDSHSRRLVPPQSQNGEVRTEDRGRTDLPQRPSLLSVRAASSALSSASLKDGLEACSGTRKERSKYDLSAVRLGLLATRNGSHDSNASRYYRGQASPIVTDSPSGGSKLKKSEVIRRLSGSSVEDFAPSRHAQPSPQAAREEEDRLAVDRTVELEEDSADDTLIRGNWSWREKRKRLLTNLPAGVDNHAAKQILNEIVVQGDQVHWNDIAGLDMAKNALREAVVYPFLRPDLFMGLREPAKGMLLFGPPGTGKTMLARAVATESKSTFFSISASSLTSKFLGESEKLVRALFAIAKVLAPSIIFVDEIDSLLSQRSGSGEHEATRRIKTEFLIQWSDLQRAAAGRDTGERDDSGDANRVLVLAATNLPWVIDEAARRRFVRRQYIPLPEAQTRAAQLRTLLGQQKHNLAESDIDELVKLTDGFSGSDITALAKDAAMGPLRSLGEALLSMSMDDIRPIEMTDFVTSLATIRPSVSKTGLKAYEDWAAEFGERGG